MDELVSNLTIENVVATAAIGHRIDLNGITKVFRNVDYRPKRFPGLVFRLKRPKTSTLIFRTGKMVFTGARSEKQAKRAIRKVLKLLRKCDIIILSNPKIEIVNVVASGHLGGNVDLEMTANIMGNVMYEPEMFPGLIHRMKEPKVVLLIFASGKIVCTGAKNEKQVYKAVEKYLTCSKEKTYSTKHNNLQIKSSLSI